MIVQKLYERSYHDGKCLYVKQCLVTYYDNDVVNMEGHTYASNIFDVVRILKSYHYKLIEVVRK